jgi:choline kinase/aminoglycoside phosphotransferase
MNEYKILLTTSGIGSRLGELTTFTNKALVRVGDKPAISHILDNYSDDIEIVVTLGYYGQHIYDFLNLVYPNKKFTFVKVSKFEGEGSSQGLSMLEASSHLQCPFIFNACDTIISEHIPEPNYNWVFGYHELDNDQYRTIEKQGSKFIKFRDKGAALPNAKDLSYIGLCGVNDFESFWEKLKPESESDCHAINEMSEDGCDFKVLECKTWLDIGNTSKLSTTRASVESEIEVLDKPEENIYLINNSIVKFFHDENISNKRVSRANKLKGLVPDITEHKNNFYKYKKVEGQSFAKTINEEKLKSFLKWCSDDLWKPRSSSQVFIEACRDFYFKKTTERIAKLEKATGIEDKEEVINNTYCQPVKKILVDLDKYKLTEGIPCKFHGDCVPDNIIEKDGKFTLIDWRQEFGGGEVGDVYYDLAKLNHGLTFDIASSNYYKVNFNKEGVEVDIFRSDKLARCREVLYDFLREYNYDIKKVEILTSLIWINMAPLHEGDLKTFLFYFGKFYLNKYYVS